MARGGSSKGSSGGFGSRGATASIKPPATNTQAPARPSMAGGLMGSMMSGMAFGAASEFMRGLFRNPVTGPNMLPLLLSGATAFGAHKFLFKNVYKNKYLYTASVFGGSFLVYRALLNRNEPEAPLY